MSYYAYLHAAPDAQDARGVFYVGKGSGRRSHDFYRRNKHHTYVVRKHGAENVLVGRIPCSSESIAFDLERGLIKCLRRMGVALVNYTDGGEGSSGAVATASTRAAMADAARKLHNRPEVKASKSAKQTIDNLKRWSDPAYRERVSAAMRGVKKTVSEASRIARRAASAKGVAARKAKKAASTNKE